MGSAAKLKYRNRAAMGLLEVIVCTGLVAVMIIPVAAVIRASARSIARAESGGTTEAEMRQALSWVGNLIEDAPILSVSRSAIRFELPDGNAAMIQATSGRLQLVESGKQTLILNDIRSIEFRDRKQNADPSLRIGIELILRKRDPRSGRVRTVSTTVSVRPQP